MNDIFKKFDKLLNEKIESDSPSVYNEYIREVKKDVLLKSANEFGTPQYILDREMLRRRCRFFIETFRKHIPRVEAFYAFKCNDMPYLVKTVLEEGFNADVAGIYELQLALKILMKKTKEVLNLQFFIMMMRMPRERQCIVVSESYIVNSI